MRCKDYSNKLMALVCRTIMGIIALLVIVLVLRAVHAMASMLITVFG